MANNEFGPPDYFGVGVDLYRGAIEEAIRTSVGAATATARGAGAYNVEFR